MERRRLLSGAVLAATALGAASCASPDPVLARARMEARRGEPRGAAAVVRDMPWVRAEQNDECGPAALASVLAKAGEPRELRVVRGEIYDPDRGGAPTSALVRYAREQRLFALVRDRWWLDDLKAWIRNDVAPVLLIDSGPFAPRHFHYVVLLGFDDERRVLLLQDGFRKELALTYDDFFPRWCTAHGWALVVCSPSIQLRPDQAGLTAHELGALGWLAEQRGELEAARRHYLAALARDPGYAAAARNLKNVERELAKGS